MCNDRIWILMSRKLSGEASFTELRELQDLLHIDPTAIQSLNLISGIWEAPPAHDEEFLEATYLAHLERMKDKGVLVDDEVEITVPATKLFSIKNILLGTGLMVCLLVGWLLLSSKSIGNEGSSKKNFGEVTTQKGSRSKIKLPDGSDVWLNAGSKLNYNKDFETGEREVYLTGEAFFDVVKDEKRPFVIHTSQINIKVLGTQFNVKAYDEDEITETSLLRGSVEVYLKKDAAKKYILKPNEKLVLSNKIVNATNDKAGKKNVEDNRIAIEPEIKALTFLEDQKTNIESSWTRNILSFEDEQFSEVAKKMERWYDVTFVFKNKKWEREYMSGSFENESLDLAMQALKFSAGFNFTIEGKTITIQ